MALVSFGLVAASLLSGCAHEQHAERPTRPALLKGTFAVEPAPTPAWLAPLAPSVSKIVDNMLAGRHPFTLLVELCDRHGHRISGSPQLEAAIDWAVARLAAAGHENAARERVVVPMWVRGGESAVIVAPRTEPMHMLGLGGSVGTGPDGIEAEVVTVADGEELLALGDAVAGRIVHFNNPMPAFTPHDGACYGHTVKYRLHGARLAAAQGAIGVLVRSVTAVSLRSPHTGALVYGDAPTKIPAAAVSTEDSDLIQRLQAAGETVRVRLQMDAKMQGEAVSGNVVAELRGREKPHEIVIVSGHIDSWDVGQGAHDDGSGVVMAMATLDLLRRLDMRPRRTIRVVLWTNEENGFAGVKSYLVDHAAELPLHVAAFEADAGGFAPDSIAVKHQDEAVQRVAQEQLTAILRLITPKVGPMAIWPGASAPDASKFVPEGVIGMGLHTWREHYFDYHHTHADTVDKVDPEELTRSAAVMAATAWVLAEMPMRLGAEVSVGQ